MNVTRQSFPLSTLFVVVAFVAVSTAMISTAVHSIQTGSVLSWIGAAVAVGVIGMLLGVAVGLHQRPRRVGVALGAVAGGFAGVVAGLLLAVAADSFGQLLGAQVGGSVVMILTAAVALWNSNDPLAREPEARRGPWDGPDADRATSQSARRLDFPQPPLEG